MSVFMDLNLCYTPDRSRLKSLVEMAANRECFQPGFPRKAALNPKTLPSGDANSASYLLQFLTKDVCLSVGFSTVAINYVFEPAAKSKQVTSNRQVRSREQRRLFCKLFCLFVGNTHTYTDQ